MISYIFYLFMQKHTIEQKAFALISFGFIFHVLSICLGVLKTGSLPVHNLSESLSITGLALAGVFIGFKYKFNLKILGIFVSPLIVIIMIAAFSLPKTLLAEVSILKGFWLILHIFLIFTGEAALGLACGIGILYLLQEKAIKNKKRGFFYKRLPSLDFLDSSGYSCIIIGFTLLTAGLITGLIYAKLIWGQFWSWDPKEIWSALTWFLYAALLHGRLTTGWQGKKSAIIAILGFIVIIFTFLGVNFLIGGHHQVFTK
ncbi:MAG: c-type cytochrome biogenesis protein CcsB [Desulfobacteraceae bacterium 4572_130]|nr:MAG: c-type cytochrome biogenesis protein CcsB [Desulfobacteraceae bacterium 4572_130]